MKKLFICLLCSFALLLCGCSSEKQNAPSASQASAPQSTGQDQKPSLSPKDSAVLTNETVLKSIADNAPQNSLLAILSNSESENYRALPEPARKMNVMSFFHGLQGDTILFTPLQSDVQILIEEVTYNSNLHWFYVNQTLYDFVSQEGECYSLRTFLSEGIPQIRITAVLNDEQQSWYCSYDGVGDRDISYLSLLSDEFPSFEYDAPYVVPFSAAAAVSDILFGYYAFWETIAYSATLVDDTYSSPIVLSEESFFQYVEAIYPGQTFWPNLINEISYDSVENTYSFEPYSHEPIATWEFSFLEENDDGNGGSVWIYVFCPNIDEFPVAYEIVWYRSKDREINNPFAFFISEIIPHDAVG